MGIAGADAVLDIRQTQGSGPLARARRRDATMGRLLFWRATVMADTNGCKGCGKVPPAAAKAIRARLRTDPAFRLEFANAYYEANGKPPFATVEDLDAAIAHLRAKVDALAVDRGGKSLETLDEENGSGTLWCEVCCEYAGQFGETFCELWCYWLGLLCGCCGEPGGEPPPPA
jgi:hypothetical protein